MGKTSLIGVSIALALAASTTATAGEGSAAELWKAKGCLNCHDKDTKKVGPAFKDIAAKKPNKAAVVEKLKSGKGHMKVTASDAELSTMVDAVLATK
ncbi:MAG: c-type cytochrome [Burkholderiales bacterium]